MQEAPLDLQDAVRKDYERISRVKLAEPDGAVTLELEVHSGSVDAARDAEATRRFTAEVAVPRGMEHLIPYDLDDPTAPFGREVIVETGARIPRIVEDQLVADIDADWNAGTRSNTVVSGGSLVLGYS